MANSTSFRWHKGILPAIILLFTFFGIVNVYSSSKANSDRSDILMIDLPSSPGGEQMPAVEFLHDKHTAALDKEKSCSRCHVQDQGGSVFKFKRVENTTPETDMAIYHDNCIGCHADTAKSGHPAGPVTGECRSCHTAKLKTGSSWQPIRFDKSLHYRHTSSPSIKPREIKVNDNCSACHHQYDPSARKLIFVTGQEENCRYCHKPLKTEESRSMRDASHAGCVNCHQTLSAESVGAGPVECAGCHDAKEREKIEIVQQPPRLKRNQPDRTLVAGWLTLLEIPEKIIGKKMNPVAMNHERHEEKTESCITCHHSSLKACSSCHTETGKEDGGWVRLDRAMHDIQSERSCTGCHETARQNDKNCAGCHTLMPKNEFKDENCGRCHAVEKARLSPLPMSPADAAGLAAEIFAAKEGRMMNIPDDQIPEKISIGRMADQYEAVDFPHRKIIRSLESRMDASTLAGYFHRDATTLCLGCHHNGPATLTPPECAACHGDAFHGDSDGRPALKGAYHGQCMECHRKMDIKEPAATDCTACHREKK